MNTTSRVTNTAVRIAGTPTDFDPANNSATAHVTGSTIPGLPNTGVPPIGSWWPALLALAIITALAVATPRRKSRAEPARRSAAPAVQAGSCTTVERRPAALKPGTAASANPMPTPPATKKGTPSPSANREPPISEPMAIDPLMAVPATP